MKRKWFIIAVGVAVLAAIAFFALPAKRTEAPAFKGPVGEPFVKGPNGPPPQ